MGFFHMRLEIQSQAYATTMSLVEVESHRYCTAGLGLEGERSLVFSEVYSA